MIKLNIKSYVIKDFFQNISSVKDLARVQLKVLEYLMSFGVDNTPISKPFLLIDSDKLQRVFLVNDDGHKIISFAFDFLIEEQYDSNTNESLPITELHYRGRPGKITLKNVSEAMTILNEYAKRDDNLYGYTISDSEEELDPGSLVLLEWILFSEAGYIRYDYDVKGFRPGVHPLNHLDVNYSDAAHYKLGLKKCISVEEMKDILDLKSECYTLTNDKENLNSWKAIKQKIKKRK